MYASQYAPQYSSHERLRDYQADLYGLERENHRRLEKAQGESSTRAQPPSEPDDSTTPTGKNKKTHYNHPYAPAARILIIYLKVDRGMSWASALKAYKQCVQRLLGDSCNMRIEMDRERDGINGAFYRFNLEIPATQPDGVRLLFDERGREYTREEKQRDHKRGLWGVQKGVVERYPEMMVYMWDEYKFFIPEADREAMYQKALRYGESLSSLVVLCV